MAELPRRANCWVRLTLHPAREDVDRVAGELWSLGTVGLEEKDVADGVRLEAFFSVAGDLTVSGRASLIERVERCAGTEVASWKLLEDHDWLADYRRQALPFALGRGFLVDPREPESGDVDSQGRTLLRLPARRAFGTGSHASTRLIVECLERLRLTGCRVLDVGTGTGILALVARHLGASSVVAVDVDLEAVSMALVNQRLNATEFSLLAGGVDALDCPGEFDVVLVNVIPQELGEAPHRIARLLRPGGTAIFSGILSDSGESFLAELREAGLSRREQSRSGDWQSWVMERQSR